MKRFKEMNKSPKDNEKNMDRKSYLGEKEYKSEFNTIISDADNLIEKKYNTVQFYGIILSYLNYYDYDNFSSIINELFIKKPKDLYEIIIIYNSKICKNQKFLFKMSNSNWTCSNCYWTYFFLLTNYFFNKIVNKKKLI